MQHMHTSMRTEWQPFRRETDPLPLVFSSLRRQQDKRFALPRGEQRMQETSECRKRLLKVNKSAQQGTASSCAALRREMDQVESRSRGRRARGFARGQGVRSCDLSRQ